MSFANFGIGLGAFTQGLSSGIDTGAKLRGMMDKGEIRKQAKSGIKTARADREADIQGKISRTGMDNRQDFMGDVTTGYKVGDKSYGSEEEARGQASKGVDSIMDRFMSDAAPVIANTYAKQGNMEMAQGWETFIQDKQTQQGMKHWATALRSAQMGDTEGFATALTEAYNSPGYMEDGASVAGHKVNKDGTIEINFERDGKQFTQTFEDTDDLVQAGVGLLSPKAAFETTMAQSQAATEARNEAAQTGAEFQQDLTRDAWKQQLKDESAASTQGQESQQTIQLLKDWNYTDDEIREMIPDILNVSNTRDSISLPDLRLRVLESLSMGLGFDRLSDEEKDNRVNQMTEMIMQESGASQKPGNPNPAVDGLGAVPGGGVPMYDTQTGKIVVR